MITHPKVRLFLLRQEYKASKSIHFLFRWKYNFSITNFTLKLYNGTIIVFCFCLTHYVIFSVGKEARR
jgi:hypothetical protein